MPKNAKNRRQPAATPATSRARRSTCASTSRGRGHDNDQDQVVFVNDSSSGTSLAFGGPTGRCWLEGSTGDGGLFRPTPVAEREYRYVYMYVRNRVRHNRCWADF